MASGYRSVPSSTLVSAGTFKQVTDFANIFKAFIGTNWLSIPFAFKQSGLLLGLGGILLIALVTDHCCQLIIKCKKAAVKATIEDMCKGYSIDTVDMDELEDRIESGIKYGDIGRMTLGRWGLGMVNTALLITQFFFCTGYFIFLGNTIASLFPAVKSEHHISGNASFHPHNHSVNGSMTSEGGDDHVKTTAPPFPLLLLVPLVPLVLMAYIRNVRKLGPVSFIANISLLIAFLSVISYMLSGFRFKTRELRMAQWATFPVFFGQVTSAYEGIGTIIPIETSMAENRRRFPCYLHLTILLLSLILAGFGILGYCVYGDGIDQIVTENLTSGALSVLVKLLLCVAILFTYPLQLVPVVRIIESWLFPNNKDTIQTKSILDTSPGVQTPYEQSQVESTVGDSATPLLMPRSKARSQRSKIRTWKKNGVRTILVILSAAAAIGLKNDFAYLAAITGSIGSSALAYILPCVFHLVLFKRTVHPIVVLKDILIICFGIVGGVVGLYVVIGQLVKQFS